MEVYNLVLVWGRVKQLARFSTKNRKAAEKEEKAVHDLLKAVQVDMNKPRLVLIRIQQMAFAVCFTVVMFWLFEVYKAGESIEIALILLCGLLGRLTRSLGAFMKVGISDNTDRRVGEINKDIENGGTEWVLVPWLLFLAIPILTWSQVRPAWAAVGVVVLSFIVFGLVKMM